MARKYTEEQLNKLDKDILITLFLGLQDQMDQMGRNLELLTEQIAIMNQRTFGRSTEKSITTGMEGQARLVEIEGELTAVFNEAEDFAGDVFKEPDEEEIFSPARKRTPRPKGKREQDLSHFPCRIEMHELTEEQLREIFGDQKIKRLPDEVYKRLVYHPAIQEVVEHHVAVYAGADGQTMVKADRPQDLLRGSIVTPSLQAAILNGKYVNGIPLARLEKDSLKRCRVKAVFIRQPKNF